MSDVQRDPTRTAGNTTRVIEWVKRKAAAIGLTIAVTGAFVAMVSGLGYQAGFWPLFPAFRLLAAGVYGAAGAAIICAVALLINVIKYKTDFVSRSGVAILGLLIGGVVYYVPNSLLISNPPPIHDVTTDFDNPPSFIEVLPLRETTGAKNTHRYKREWKMGDGENARVINVVELQKKHFQDIRPVMFEGKGYQEVFQKALQAAKKQRWTIISVRPELGRIEAFDKTPWFGFYDDVVIRVTEAHGGTRVDIRSNSRIGLGDVGKNAQRIRQYIRDLAGTNSH